MKLGVMQPYLFPYLGYWQLVNTVDKYIILDDVTFIKQGYINRNNILVQGKAQAFNIQVKDISSNKLIKDHFLNPDPRWKKKLLKTIEQSYRKAPQFETVFPLISDCIRYEEQNLAKYLAYSIRSIGNFLGINTEIVMNSDADSGSESTGSERIVDLCMEHGATEYINSIGGQSLYSKEHFASKGIDLRFLEMNKVEYAQYNHEFVPYLSIIDVLMHCSLEEVSKLLNEYELV